MSSNQNGIFVPNRVIFIMVGVSVCINLFFLLLGILIGRDDLKWERAKPPEEAIEVQKDPEPENRLDRELSVFEPESERDKPLDITYQGTEEKDSEPVTVADPDPPDTSPKSVKNETPPANSDGGFWIQALASKDRQQADSFLKLVRDKGYAGVVLPEGGYFKVQIGPYMDRRIAEREKNKINQAFKINCWIRAR